MATRAEPIARTGVKQSSLARALTTVDHKAIGARYILTAFLFFCVAGIEALFMRAQLATPESSLLSPDIYSQFFTIHGTTMIFFSATPALFGFGSYLVPWMIGARNLAFPRLNAFGYWVFLLSGFLLHASLLVGVVPNGGWTGYIPASGAHSSPGLVLDFLSLSLIFLSIAFFAEAVNCIVTILKRRASGLSLNRMPLFAWAMLVASFFAILAALSLVAANILLILERRNGIQFFGNASQHLLWVFGFPQLFILLLPVIGLVSEVVVTFSRRRVLGYSLLVFATVAVGVTGFILWAAHLVALAIAPLALDFSGIDSSLIAIPAGILVATWLATLLTGRPVWRTPLLWIGGFIFLFVTGGLASLLMAIPPYDRLLTGTAFAVARLHYMLVGGVVFPLLAGLFYWFPKFSGRMLGERLGKLQFWLFFIGFNLTFFPQFILGLEGMTRRSYTYLPGMGWDGLNLLAAIGGLTIAESVLVFIVNLIASLSRGAAIGENPWDSRSPEWAAAEGMGGAVREVEKI